MKRSTLLLSFVLLSSGLIAQSTFSVGGIYSLPVGSYGQSGNDGGFAQSGFGLQLETQMAPMYFGPNLRLGVYFSYQQNPMDLNSMADVLNASIDPQYEITLEGGGYSPVRFMVGPTYHINLDPMWSLNLKGGVGIMITNMHPIEITATDVNTMATEYTDVLYVQGRTAFSYLVGADISYKISKYWSFGAFIDFSGANQSLEAAFDTDLSVAGEQSITFLNQGVFFRMNM